MLLSLAKVLEVALAGGELQKVEALEGGSLPDGLLHVMSQVAAVRPSLSSLGAGAPYYGPFFT